MTTSPLVLGPLIRYVDETSASLWVETAERAVVTVRAGGWSWEARTFAAHDHHYALVVADGLEPGSITPYVVEVDGAPVWPPGLAAPDAEGAEYPPSVIATLMRAPGGPLLVAAVGLGVLVVAGFLAHRGWTEKFTSKLDSRGRTGKEGRAYVLSGKIGYLGKAVAIAIVGALFLYAAATQDPRKSGGLDVALHKILQQPYGGPVLVVVALGFAGYGVFCFAWARHLDR